ncbi:unknown protein [Desulfotalea psychrophila LSv54]|uniref:Uncharacterized protein n=2 Tax=Desulfotalea psychrophila TaxID=84980 RepID=Q6AMZ7_DESPS|nr:unknown protein [Desulfotalea psychrophila LSv54]
MRIFFKHKDFHSLNRKEEPMSQLFAFIGAIVIFLTPANLLANDILDFFDQTITTVSKQQGERNHSSAVASSFFCKGRVFLWESSAGQGGEMKVIWSSGNRFGISQINRKNRAAGEVAFSGEIKGNRVILENREWGELWRGAVHGNKIVGKIDGVYTFRIWPRKPKASSQPPGKLFREGKVLKWNASSGQGGKMRVTWRSGNRFKVAQTNDKNRAAGEVLLYGKMSGNRVTIENREWNEVWRGVSNGSRVKGKINQRYDFKIWLPASAISKIEKKSALLEKGNLFRWHSSAGQEGKMEVTWIRGSRFRMSQTNRNNRAAGKVILHGKRKGNRIILESPQWDETWVGTITGRGEITGKINGQYGFRMKRVY